MCPTLTALAFILAGGAMAPTLAAVALPPSVPATFFANGVFSDRPENLDSIIALYATVKAQPQEALALQDGPHIWGNQLTVLMSRTGDRPIDEPTARYAMELAMWAATAEASDNPEETKAALLSQRIPATITWVQYRDLQILRRAWTAAVP